MSRAHRYLVCAFVVGVGLINLHYMVAGLALSSPVQSYPGSRILADPMAHLELLAKDQATIRPCIIKQSVAGQWADVSNEVPPRLVLHVMELLTRGMPMAWVRWADGDVNDFNDGKRTFEMSMAASKWPRLRNLYVAVHTQHICRLRTPWNAFIRAAGLQKHVFLDYFYLPSVGSEEWRRLGVRGWLEETRNRPRVFVGPSSLRSLASCLAARYIQAVGPLEQLEAQMSAESESTRQAVVFVVCAGSLAKLLITRLFARPANKDSFIDVGTSLFKNGVATQANAWASSGPGAGRCPLRTFVPSSA